MINDDQWVLMECLRQLLDDFRSCMLYVAAVSLSWKMNGWCCGMLHCTVHKNVMQVTNVDGSGDLKVW